MHVVIFGATGMIGQGVLRECLLDPDVERVLSLVRAPTGRLDPKLTELVHANFLDFLTVESQLQGFNACFFCLGVSSAGMSAERYRQTTYGITLAAAQSLSRVNTGMAFIYVSGAGADRSGRSRAMWARVKGETENALFKLPFRAVYIFRPAVIVPLHGIRSRTALYRIFYAVLKPLLPLLRASLPGQVTTTEQIGRAMIAAARRGAPQQILETRDINAL
jgi:uncharacterized protein YbjT (DUF2867 family)